MLKLLSGTRRNLKSEDGATMVEYAFMLAFIALICFAAVQGLGLTVKGLFPASI